MPEVPSQSAFDDLVSRVDALEASSTGTISTGAVQRIEALETEVSWLKTHRHTLSSLTIEIQPTGGPVP